MKKPLDRTDAVLLGTYLFAALLGTWNRCLLLHDGAVLISAGWLGNGWDLYYSQLANRAVSTLPAFAPAWILRELLDLSAGAYVTLAHILYFATPLAVWMGLRAVEQDRTFSRLYLAIVLPLIYFLAEVAIASGLWLIWMALLSNTARPTRHVVVASGALALAMAFSQPVTALMSLLYLVAAGTLVLFGRPLPRRTLIGAAAMAVFLLGAYAITNSWLPASNPTMVASVNAQRFRYIDPVWMIATLILYPMLAALWALLLAPGLARVPKTVWSLVAVAGLWFAAAGAGLLTWLYARYTAPYILVVAVVLALGGPRTWLGAARGPLTLYAAVVATAVASYNVDLFLFGRFVDRHLTPGVIDVEAMQPTRWPAQYAGPAGARIYFKWGAGDDYVRDVVVPTYDWYEVTLAFYSFFRSGRQSVLFHPLGGPKAWLPFECPAVARALAGARDDKDRVFLDFLAARYCVR